MTSKVFMSIQIRLELETITIAIVIIIILAITGKITVIQHQKYDDHQYQLSTINIAFIGILI